VGKLTRQMNDIVSCVSIKLRHALDCGVDDNNNLCSLNISGSRTPLVIKVVAGPLAILSISLVVCFLCFKNNNRKREAQAAAAAALMNKSNHHSKSKSVVKQDTSESNNGGDGSSCCTNCCCCVLKSSSGRNQPSSDEKCHPSAFGEEEAAPITRGPIYFKNELE